MTPRPHRILAVVTPSSTLPFRLKSLGHTVSTADLDWWLGPTVPPAGVDAAVVELNEGTKPWAELFRSGARKGWPTVWLTDDAPDIDLYQAETEVALPIFAAARVSDTGLELALLTACRLHEETWARRTAETQARAFQDLASRLSIGLFRYFSSASGTAKIEFFSRRAGQLLNVSREQLENDPDLWYSIMLPEDRETYRAFVANHRTRRRPAHIRIRVFVRGLVRTLLIRFDEAQFVGDGVALQGIIEDVTEQTQRAGYGDRALDLLRGLRDNLQFLDLVEPAPPPPGGVFSKREQEVFQLVRAGLSNTQIGLRLGCSESTIKKHVSAIYEKVGVHTRAQLLTVDWNGP